MSTWSASHDEGGGKGQPLPRGTLQRLASLVGDELVVERERVRARPRTPEAMRRLIAFAAAEGIPWGEDGAAPLLVDRGAFCHVGLVETRPMWIRCGAAASVDAVETALRRHRLTLGPQPPSVLRGRVAAWLEGPLAGRRAMDGRLESGVAAVEAVLPDGTLFSSRAAPRSAAGPAVAHLILGGAGRCGLLLNTTLKARRQPQVLEHVVVDGPPAAIASLLQQALHGVLAPWEVWFRGGGSMVVAWPVDREDERAALESFCGRARLAGLGAARTAAGEPPQGEVEREFHPRELPRLLEALDGRGLRLVRLAPTSCVAVCADEAPLAGLEGVAPAGALFDAIAAALRG